MIMNYNINSLINIMENQALRSAFTLWIFSANPVENQNQLDEKESFNDSIKPIHTVSTIKQFWETFQHMRKPSQMPEDSDIYFFKEGVKPLWEDPANKKGGYFNLRIQRNKSSKIWENLMLLIVCPFKDSGSLINGIRLKKKKENDSIQIWVSFGENERQKMEAMKNYLKENIQITDDKAYKYMSIQYHLRKLEMQKKKVPFKK